MTFRCGTLGFDTSQGLGVLAKALFDNGVLSSVLVLEHGRRVSNRDWFPGQPRLGNVHDWPAIRAYLDTLDVFLALETPFDWRAFPYCRTKGIKTALMPMGECEPDPLPEKPDLFLCPSLWDLKLFPEHSVHLPVPVSVPWRPRERAEVFVHNAGHSGLRGRNGTAELLAALHLVKSPCRFVLRTQGHWGAPVRDPRVELHSGTVPFGELWSEGDCFLWPDKFQGLSLPLQEAFASGLACLASDRFPHNAWLPREPLIPVRGYRRARVSPRCLEFDEALIDPRDIAAKIDEFYGKDIRGYSEAGRKWAQENSWERWAPEYRRVLQP